MSAERVLLMLESHQDAGEDARLLLTAVTRDELSLSPSFEPSRNTHWLYNILKRKKNIHTITTHFDNVRRILLQKKIDPLGLNSREIHKPIASPKIRG